VSHFLPTCLAFNAPRNSLASVSGGRAIDNNLLNLAAKRAAKREANLLAGQSWCSCLGSQHRQTLMAFCVLLWAVWAGPKARNMTTWRRCFHDSKFPILATFAARRGKASRVCQRPRLQNCTRRAAHSLWLLSSRNLSSPPPLSSRRNAPLQASGPLCPPQPILSRVSSGQLCMGGPRLAARAKR